MKLTDTDDLPPTTPILAPQPDAYGCKGERSDQARNSKPPSTAPNMAPTTISEIERSFPLFVISEPTLGSQA